MDYYQALEQEMRREEKEVSTPLDLTYEQMVCRIEEITEFLKKSGVRSSERIILSAERHGLRLRLKRAEDVAKRLLGKSEPCPHHGSNKRDWCDACH